MASSMIGSVVNGAMGTVGTVFSAIAGIKADKKLDKLLETDPRYTSSPYAQNNLGMAQQLLNSRMSGLASRENNISTSGANARARVSANTTDSSQALAMMAGLQGQEGQQYNDLAMQEAQDAQMKQQNLFGANKDMTAEHKDLYDDEVRRWQDQVNTTMTQYKMRQKGGDNLSQMGSSASSLSDKRLKHNYRIIGKSPSGINIYEFSYLGSNDRYIGCMAQEVGDAAFDIGNGILAVDYSKIDVQFKQVS